MFYTLRDLKEACPSFFNDKPSSNYKLGKVIYQGTGGVYLVSSDVYNGFRRYYIHRFDIARREFFEEAGPFNRRYLAIKEASRLARFNESVTLTLANGMQIVWPPNLPLPEEFRDAGK